MTAHLLKLSIPHHRSAVSIIRVDGTFQVGSAEPQQLGPGPAWARAAAAREAAGAEGLVQRDAIRDDFKLLYAGTADKVMMMELEADQVGPWQLWGQMVGAERCSAARGGRYSERAAPDALRLLYLSAVGRVAHHIGADLVLCFFLCLSLLPLPLSLLPVACGR